MLIMLKNQLIVKSKNCFYSPSKTFTYFFTYFEFFKVDGYPQSAEVEPPSSGPGPQPGQFSGPQPGPHRGPGPLPAPFNNFTTQALNDIVNGLIMRGIMFKGQMGNKGMVLQCALGQLRSMFDNYNKTLDKAGSCATDDMKALTQETITAFLSCLPTQEQVEQKKEEAKQKFNELLDKLKAEDEKISAITDDLQKLIEISQAEWTLVLPFTSQLSESIFKEISAIHQCLATKRTEVQTKVINNLAVLETCKPQ